MASWLCYDLTRWSMSSSFWKSYVIVEFCCSSILLWRIGSCLVESPAALSSSLGLAWLWKMWPGAGEGDLDLEVAFASRL